MRTFILESGQIPRNTGDRVRLYWDEEVGYYLRSTSLRPNRCTRIASEAADFGEDIVYYFLEEKQYFKSPRLERPRVDPIIRLWELGEISTLEELILILNL